MEYFKVSKEDFELLKTNAVKKNMTLVKATNFNKANITLAISGSGDIAYEVEGDDKIKTLCDYSRAFIQADDDTILYINWIDERIIASITLIE